MSIEKALSIAWNWPYYDLLKKSLSVYSIASLFKQIDVTIFFEMKSGKITACLNKLNWYIYSIYIFGASGLLGKNINKKGSEISPSHFKTQILRDPKASRANLLTSTYPTVQATAKRKWLSICLENVKLRGNKKLQMNDLPSI